MKAVAKASTFCIHPFTAVSTTSHLPHLPKLDLTDVSDRHTGNAYLASKASDQLLCDRLQRKQLWFNRQPDLDNKQPFFTSNIPCDECLRAFLWPCCERLVYNHNALYAYCIVTFRNGGRESPGECSYLHTYIEIETSYVYRDRDNTIILRFFGR